MPRSYPNHNDRQLVTIAYENFKEEEFDVEALLLVDDPVVRTIGAGGNKHSQLARLGRALARCLGVLIEARELVAAGRMRGSTRKAFRVVQRHTGPSNALFDGPRAGESYGQALARLKADCLVWRNAIDEHFQRLAAIDAQYPRLMYELRLLSEIVRKGAPGGQP